MKTHPSIVFFSTTPCDMTIYSRANNLYNFDIRFFEERITQLTASLAAGGTIVCAGSNDDLCSDTINTLAAGGTRLLAMRTTGFSNVNMAAAKAAGVEVCRVNEYCPESTAEYALAMLLTLKRGIHHSYCRVREGDFSGRGLHPGMTLHGKTAGIIGTGRIGKHFAALLRGFGLRLLAYDPDPDYDTAARYNIKYVSLPELLRHSDIISLHCPLNPASSMMLDRDAFARMKPGTVIINTGRSGMIDMQVLLENLRSDKLGGAALDIYEEENDFLLSGHSSGIVNTQLLEDLIKEKNVILTFKQGIKTRECIEKNAEAVLHNILSFVNNAPRDPEFFICTACNGSRNCPGKTPFIKCTQPELAPPADSR